MAIQIGVQSVHAMTQEQIDEATKRGMGARNVKQVPLFERAGGVKAPSDMVRDAILPLSGAGYFYLVGSGKQWVQNTVYLAKTAGELIPQCLIRDQCLGRDDLRVAILGDWDANAAFGVMTFRFPLPPRPVASIFLRVDGIRRDQKPGHDFNKFGTGNGYAVFDAAGLTEAKRVWIVVTVDGVSDELRLNLKRKVMRKLYR